MVPALVAICWWPWLTGTDVAVSLLAGILAVTLTDALGGYFPWGKYPFTIHSTGWRILFNFGLAILVSELNRTNLLHRLKFHDFFRQHARLSETKKSGNHWSWCSYSFGFFSQSALARFSVTAIGCSGHRMIQRHGGLTSYLCGAGKFCGGAWVC